MDQVQAAVRAFLDGGPGLWLAPGDGTAPDGCAVMATSGSTGAAKFVVLRREALASAALAARDRLGFDATWHLALGPRYVAGLMVLVRGLLGNGVRVCDSSLSDAQPMAGRNALSIVATQLYRALEDPAVTESLAGFDAILVGGAALAPDLRARAEAAGLHLIETYGMSETSGGVVWDGHPLPGVEIRLGEHGRVAIAGPMIFDGYLGNPDATAESLVDGAVVTRDRGRWVGDTLVIDGRIDDVVITGGVNVDLAEVRRAVARLDPEADVVAVPDDEWGVRLVLAATSGDLAGWRDRLRPHLDAPALPRQLLVVPELPRTDGGKPDRQALMALAGSA